MTMTVRRQSPSEIDDAALDGGEVTFQLPPEVKKEKLEQLDAVDTKVSVKLRSILLRCVMGIKK